MDDETLEGKAKTKAEEILMYFVYHCEATVSKKDFDVLTKIILK